MGRLVLNLKNDSIYLASDLMWSEVKGVGKRSGRGKVRVKVGSRQAGKGSRTWDMS
jgi:hypothetical protein